MRKVEEPVETSALFVRGSEEKKKSWCDHCKKLWHTKETCWKIHGNPAGFKKKSERVFQATVSETPQEDQINSGQLPFTKEQIEQLLKIIQPTQNPNSEPRHAIPSCSFAQDGTSNGEDDWQY
ncbi:unnamed protein product [Rhodiola kirilowii]